MSEWTWAGAHVPGLDGQGLSFLAPTDRDEAVRLLTAAGYTVIRVDGTSITDARSARTVLTGALQLEPTAANNDDAFADSLSDVTVPAGAQRRLVLVWEHAEVLIASDIAAWTTLAQLLTVASAEAWDPEQEDAPSNLVFETVAVVDGFGVKALS